MTSSNNLREFTVHEFRLADCDDPEIYAAQPIAEWEKTKKGSWVLKRAAETPTYYITTDPASISYRCVIKAKFTERDAVEYVLKFSK